MLLLTTFGCKKHKLTGNDHTLIGTWQWVRTTGEFTDLNPDNTGHAKTLNCKENGKYIITEGSKKIENGDLDLEDPKPAVPDKHVVVKFVRQDLFSKKQEFPGTCIIWFSGPDTITIRENADWTDQDYHVYVKQ